MVLDPMDWKAAMDGQIFREYVKNELHREAEEAQNVRSVETLESELDKSLEVRAQMEAFQKKVYASDKLSKYFKQCQIILTGNENIRKHVNQKFAEGVMLFQFDVEASAEDAQLDVLSRIVDKFIGAFDKLVSSGKAEGDKSTAIKYLKSYLKNNQQEEYFNAAAKFVSDLYFFKG